VILVGRYRSPFSRRVAIALRLLGIAYEHRPYTAWSNLDAVRAVNPVGRVPALVLDSGETLFDSSAILDYLDHEAGPARALVPFSEPSRRHILRITACAFGALEKVVAALYERTMHPPGKIHMPWIVHNENQARGGFEWLDALGADRWLGGERLTQADITTVVTYDFTRIVNPSLLPVGAYPRLDALAARCSELEPFRATFPGDAVDQSNPALPA
jgi:glutathione S-transferase